LPTSLPWRPFLGVIGNQRISFSLLLALSAAMALHLSLQASSPRRRYVLALGVAVCLAGLALQDRRTGMLAAPVLLAALAMAYLRTWLRRLALLAVITAAAASAWHFVPPVQQRFAEGVAELQSYHSEGDVRSSWGMRARMLEVTARMAAERPILGHGLGSWVTRWRERVTGSAVLEGNTTPHNEYLLLLVQGGLVALAGLLLLVVRTLRGVSRHGKAAVPAVLVLTAIAWAALFNVVLRDSKFALPLLTLSALAWAASTIAQPVPALARAKVPHQAV
jgi:O-antigen ligase